MDPAKFSGPDGPIRYEFWKTLMLVEFLIDAPFFHTERGYMSNMMNCAEGDLQVHLFARYRRDCPEAHRYSTT